MADSTDSDIEQSEDHNESSKITLARIKYLEGSLKSKCETVLVTRLNRQFHSSTFDKHIKYILDGNLKVQLFHLAKNEEEMSTKLKSKTRQLPLKQLQTASESEMETPLDEQRKVNNKKNKNSSCKSTLDENGRTSKEARDKYFDRLLKLKTRDLLKSRNSQKDVDENASMDADEKSEEHDDQFQDDVTAALSSKRARSPYVADTGCLKKPKMNDDEEQLSTNADNIEPVEVSKETVRSDNKKADQDCSSKPTITFNELVNCNTVLEQNKDINKLEKDLKIMKGKYDKEKKEKSKLSKKYSDLKSSFANLEADRDKLKELNYDLQTKVIEAAEEKKIIDEQVAKSRTEPIANAKDLPTGYTRKNGDVHLGNGQFISATTLSNVHSDSHTPGQLVGNLLVAVFSESVLKNSTKTGRPSNRSKSKTGLAENDGKVAVSNKPNKLDATLLEACRAYYKFWLETFYKSYLSQKDQLRFEPSVEYSRFDKYVTNRISNIKKPKEPSRAKIKESDESVETNEAAEESDGFINPLLTETLPRSNSLLFVTPPNDTDSEKNSEVDEEELHSEEDNPDPLQD